MKSNSYAQFIPERGGAGGVVSSLRLSRISVALVVADSAHAAYKIGGSPSLFADVKAWLWLCARYGEVRRTRDRQSQGYRLDAMAMLEYFAAIDNGWHEFILMTQDYHA